MVLRYMGVKLTDIVPRKQITFESLVGKIIVIDFSNSAFQFLSSIRQPDGTPLMDSKGQITSHLMGIWSRFSNLMQQNIKLVVVLDGKPPILKVKEQEERAYRKSIAREKYQEAKAREDIELMAKYAKQTSHLSKEMVDESKNLIEAMGLPVIQAPSEADAQMAFMNQQGDVWACASSDFDCLIHGAPRLVTNLTLSQRRKLPSGAYIKITPELIELEETLSSLNINQDQLLAIALLVGTDYHEGVPRIGPKTALKLVNQYKDFDTLFKEVKADFNWKQIYAVFKSMPVMKNYQIKWKDPDPEKIKKILVDEHEFSEERVSNVISKLLKKKGEKSQSGLGKWIG